MGTKKREKKKSKKKEDSEDDLPEEFSEKEQEKEKEEEEYSVPRKKWRCPVCEQICICQKCRKDQKLPPIGGAIKEIRKRVEEEGQFNSLWDYFIYLKEVKMHPKSDG